MIAFIVALCLMFTLLGILAVDYNSSQIGFDVTARPPLLDRMLDSTPRLSGAGVLLPEKLALLLEGGAFVYQMRDSIARWFEQLMSPVTEEYGDALYVSSPRDERLSRQAR